jgi:hypothetical protein
LARQRQASSLRTLRRKKGEIGQCAYATSSEAILMDALLISGRFISNSNQRQLLPFIIK